MCPFVTDPYRRHDYICVYAYENICTFYDSEPLYRSLHVVSCDSKNVGKFYRFWNMNIHISTGRKKMIWICWIYIYIYLYIAFFFNTFCILLISLFFISILYYHIIPILMYFLLFILLSENNAIANFRGESRHDTVLLHDCLRPRVQRHKNFTHCHVMNIMATNGISPPLAN